MKPRLLKLFGISLALVIVASMFVFGAPISAKSTTNDKFLPVTFGISGASPISKVTSYHGPATVLSDGTTSVTKDGVEYHSTTVTAYRSATFSFAPIGSLTGTCVLSLDSVINYKSLKWVYNGTYEFDFGANGTLTFRVHNSREFRYFYLGSEVWDANAHMVAIAGTGDFVNFHCNGGYYFDYTTNPKGDMVSEFVGWLAP